jgi:hypothetical protein
MILENMQINYSLGTKDSEDIKKKKVENPKSQKKI